MPKRIKRRPTSLQKKARRGFRGYPVATVAFYGPNDERASKVAVGIIPAEGAPTDQLERWFAEGNDVRHDHDSQPFHGTSGTPASLLARRAMAKSRSLRRFI